jgi:hypothetical protein
MAGSACISGSSFSLRARSSGVFRSFSFSTHSLSVHTGQGVQAKLLSDRKRRIFIAEDQIQNITNNKQSEY